MGRSRVAPTRDVRRRASRQGSHLVHGRATGGRQGDARRCNRPLELALYNGEWATPDGTLATPVEAYAESSGTVEVLVIRWRERAADGLTALAIAVPDDPLLAMERDRLASAAAPPPGWRHLW